MHPRYSLFLQLLFLALTRKNLNAVDAVEIFEEMAMANPQLVPGVIQAQEAPVSQLVIGYLDHKLNGDPKPDWMDKAGF